MKTKKNNGMCLAGFIMGLLGAMFYWIYAITPILAIILSVMGLNKFDNDLEKGKTFGYWGLGLGIVYSLLFFAKLTLLGKV